MEPKVIDLGNGLFKISYGGQVTEALPEAEARKAASDFGIEFNPVFEVSAEDAKKAASSEVKTTSGQLNSVFANAKKQTGLANAGEMKAPEEYKQMEQQLLTQLKGQYSANTAEKVAKGMVQTQIAADRVESSVYFTPDKKADFEAQKEQLEKDGKRPVLLTDEDMKLLHSDNFILRNGKGEPIDKDGKVIKKDDPDAKSKYVTAFNEDGTLNQDMVKLISAQRVGSENELEFAERDAETRQLRTDIEGGVVTKEKSQPTVDLYERLGYDVKKEDDAIAAAPLVDVAKAKRRGGLLGGLIGGIVGAIETGLLSLLKTNKKVGEEEVTIPGQSHTITGGTHTVPGGTTTTIIPGTEGYYDPDTVIGDTFGGGTGSQTIPGAWHEGTPGETITTENDPIEVTDPDVVVQDDDITYTQDVYEEKSIMTPGVAAGLIGTNALAGSILGAKIAANNAEKKNLAAAAAQGQEEEDIFVTMDHREAAVNAFYNGDFVGIKGENNQDVMKQIVAAAKEKNISQEEFARLMKFAQGSNEVMTEKELMGLAAMVNDYKKADKPEEVTDNLDAEDGKPVDGGRDPRYDTAEVTHQDAVKVANRPYKMQKGDVIANVIRAKYGITDPKDLREAIKAVRRATGMNENGTTGRKVEVNGKMVWEPQIATIEVDGKKLIDAYFLPETLTIGDKTYGLDMDKDVSKEKYNKAGQAIQGKNEEIEVRPEEWRTTARSTGEELYSGNSEEKANAAKTDYDNKKVTLPGGEE